MTTGHKFLRWIPIVLALAVGTSTAMWPTLKFVKMGASDLVSRLSILLFFSLLIERTVEIILSIWRSETSNTLESKLRLALSGRSSSVQPEDAKTALIQYRAETLQWAMPVSFALGLLISALGVRALGQFLDQAILLDSQRWWFNFSDIVFTGALLAGGADPIHKILDLYRKVMESSAEKAAGTKS